MKQLFWAALGPSSQQQNNRGRTNRGILVVVSPQAAKGSKSKRGKGKAPTKKVKQQVKALDVFSPVAMLNAYYICHNAADFLELRGFPWPGSPKRKGKKGKKKK